MRQGLRLVIVLPAAALLATGCATRDWVRETLGKKEAELDQRVTSESQRVDKRIAEEAQRVEGMGFRLAETGTVALGARDRADAAFAKADEVSSRLTRLWDARHQRNLVETVQVRFGFDRWELNDAAQTALLTLIKELRENPRLAVDLEGYADPKGTFDYNVALSQRRVEAVRRYLVDKGVALPRIHSVGLGPLLDGGQPDEQKRRVTVKLMVQPD
ncbi:MAG: OmpA family protein [Candidatus Rokubacteria bacterium]|nr:OmpA family protein [Candidatus Rokubacteria bacterium]